MLWSFIQKCSFIFFLLAAVTLAAPTNRHQAAPGGQDALQRAARSSPPEFSSAPPPAATLEEELVTSITTMADLNQQVTTEMSTTEVTSTQPNDEEATGSPEGAETYAEKNIDFMVTTESTCIADQTHAVASFEKGLSLAYDLQDRYIRVSRTMKKTSHNDQHIFFFLAAPDSNSLLMQKQGNS